VGHQRCDIQDAVQTAVGANALTQVQQGEGANTTWTLRYQQPYRDTREAIESIRLLAPSGERVSLAQLTKVSTDGRRRRDLSRRRTTLHSNQILSARTRPGIRPLKRPSASERNVQLPPGYHL